MPSQNASGQCLALSQIPLRIFQGGHIRLVLTQRFNQGCIRRSFHSRFIILDIPSM